MWAATHGNPLISPVHSLTNKNTTSSTVEGLDHRLKGLEFGPKDCGRTKKTCPGLCYYSPKGLNKIEVFNRTPKPKVRRFVVYSTAVYMIQVNDFWVFVCTIIVHVPPARNIILHVQYPGTHVCRTCTYGSSSSSSSSWLRQVQCVVILCNTTTCTPVL